MNKKKLLAVAAIVLMIVSVVVVAVIKNNVVTSDSSSVPDGEQSSSAESTTDEGDDSAEFDLIYSERLAGYPATDYNAVGSVAEVRFGDKGYIRKTYEGADNTNLSDEYTETTEQDIDRMKVTFKGKDGKVWLAVWNYNNYAYTICISPDVDGVSPEDMIDYVKETR